MASKLKRIARTRRVAIAFIGAVSCLLIPGIAKGQPTTTYEVVHAFPSRPENSVAPLLLASDGAFYGVSQDGGAHHLGTVYVMRPKESGGFNLVVTLHSFDGSDGESPSNGLVEGADGALYGTTNGLPTTVFRITKQGIFTTLHEWGVGSNLTLVVGDDGNLYGTSRSTIFRLTLDGTHTVLHTFAEEEGGGPSGLLVAGDGSLVGTLGPTDSTPSGSIFRITTGGSFAIVHRFARINSSDIVPRSGLTAGADGNFYGLATLLATGATLFFKATPAWAVTLIPNQLANLLISSREGRLALGPDGNFYTTVAKSPGSNGQEGKAFRLTPGGAVTILHSFSKAEGVSASGLTVGPGGLLYGVTLNGSFGNHGYVFSLTMSGQVTPASFFTGREGENPWSGPIRGTDGALYGTTLKGGYFDLGTIYRLAPDGTFTTLHVFSGSDGAVPYAGLAQASDGFFYGAAFWGGCAGRGTIFRISPTGDFTTLHCFGTQEGGLPYATLLAASDGNLYGSTLRGPLRTEQEHGGSIFKISRTGVLTTLKFLPCSSLCPAIPTPPRADQTVPVGILVEGPDDRLYGTAFGIPGNDVIPVSHAGVFRISKTPSDNGGAVMESLLTDLQFLGGLTRSSDGNFYFVTYPGQFFGRMAPNGAWQSLHQFGSDVGRYPVAPPIEAADGFFYGTTAEITGGDPGGTIYRVSAAGEFETLKLMVNVDGAHDGAHPVSGLIETNPGVFYSTNYAGGPLGSGLIFRFTVQ